jgi:hypothetical protein
VLQYHFNWKTLSAMAGVTWWNFYFRLFPGSIPQPPGRSVSPASPASSRLQALGGLGRVPHPSQSFSLGLCTRTERTAMARISSRLRSRLKPRRVSLVPLEATRTAQLLSADLLAAEPLCSSGPSSHAQTNHPGNWFLGPSRAVLKSLYYVILNSALDVVRVAT